MSEPAAALVLFNPHTLPPLSLSLRGQIEGYIYIKDKESKESEEASAPTLGI